MQRQHLAAESAQTTVAQDDAAGSEDDTCAGIKRGRDRFCEDGDAAANVSGTA